MSDELLHKEQKERKTNGKGVTILLPPSHSRSSLGSRSLLRLPFCQRARSRTWVSRSSMHVKVTYLSRSVCHRCHSVINSRSSARFSSSRITVSLLVGYPAFLRDVQSRFTWRIDQDEQGIVFFFLLSFFEQ